MIDITDAALFYRLRMPLLIDSELRFARASALSNQLENLR